MAVVCDATGSFAVIMKYEKFGDSYDFVKRGILQLLSCCGDWSVHPMFTDDPNAAHYAADYRRLIGVCTVTDQSFVQSGRNRNAWLEAARTCQNHLLIDPDTGLPFNETGRRPTMDEYEGVNADAEFLNASELAEIAKARPYKLTLVFDQSFHRVEGGIPSITDQINGKLWWVSQQELHGLVYHTHASFLLVSMDQDAILAARRRLEEFNFPGGRLIPD